MQKITTALAVCLLFLAQNAQAKVCDLTIAGNDMMKYDKTSLTVDNSCEKVTLTLHHSGKLPKAAMGHNWVLTKAKDKTIVVSASVTAGIKADFLKKDDPRILAATSMIGGGEKTSATFETKNLTPTEKYVFFCTFPGHAGLMHGEFIFTSFSDTASAIPPPPPPPTGEPAPNPAEPRQ